MSPEAHTLKSTPSMTLAGEAPARFTFRHFPQLDGLRGASILLVLIGHSLHFSARVPGHWGNLAGLGVLLFFGLSGFLITGLLYQEELRQGRVNIFQFYVNRVLRIFPAYYFFLAVATALMALRLITDVPWYSLGVCAVYLRNIFGRGDSLTHIWSLSLEEQFYALWPWVVWRVSCRKLLGWALAAVGVITAWRTLAICLELWSYADGRFYVRPDFRFDSILIGCCLALFFFRYGREAKPARWLAKATHPLWLYPALLGWTYYASEWRWARPVYLTAQMVLAAGVLYRLLVVEDDVWSRWFSQGWLRYFGKLSYSIYLWQQIFLVTKQPDWGWLRVFPVDLVLCCLAGAFSHYIVERPFLNFKERLRQRPAQWAMIPWIGPRLQSLAVGIK